MNNFIKIQRIQLETIYRLILKRIAKGYTAEQLSLLIGRDPDYITALELLQIPLGTDYELQEIAWALGETDFSSFFPKINQFDFVNVFMEKEIYGNTYIHTCDIITENGKEVPFFFLQEEVTDSPCAQQNAKQD